MTNLLQNRHLKMRHEAIRDNEVRLCEKSPAASLTHPGGAEDLVSEVVVVEFAVSGHFGRRGLKALGFVA